MEEGLRNSWAMKIILMRGRFFTTEFGTLAREHFSEIISILKKLERNIPMRSFPSATHKDLYEKCEEYHPGDGKDYVLCISWIWNKKRDKKIPVSLDVRKSNEWGGNADFFFKSYEIEKMPKHVKCPVCGAANLHVELIHEVTEFMPAKAFLSVHCDACKTSERVYELDIRRDILSYNGARKF